MAQKGLHGWFHFYARGLLIGFWILREGLLIRLRFFDTLTIQTIQPSKRFACKVANEAMGCRELAKNIEIQA